MVGLITQSKSYNYKKDFYDDALTSEQNAPTDIDSIRPDGSKKGPGYFGNLNMLNDKNKYATELSIGVNFDGEEHLIPSIVPTLSKSELNHLLSGGKVTPMIKRKAVEFSKKRIAQQKSPFAEDGEKFPMPEYSDNPLTRAVIDNESASDVNAVSSKGNTGLMQIGKSVLKEYNARMNTALTTEDLFDAEVNVNIGEWYLQMRIPEMLEAKGLPVTEKNIIWAYRAGVESVASGRMPKNIKDYVNKVLAAYKGASDAK